MPGCPRRHRVPIVGHCRHHLRHVFRSNSSGIIDHAEEQQCGAVHDFRALFCHGAHEGAIEQLPFGGRSYVPTVPATHRPCFPSMASLSRLSTLECTSRVYS